MLPIRRSDPTCNSKKFLPPAQYKLISLPHPTLTMRSLPSHIFLSPKALNQNKNPILKRLRKFDVDKFLKLQEESSEDKELRDLRKALPKLFQQKGETYMNLMELTKEKKNPDEENYLFQKQLTHSLFPLLIDKN
jgi:hypothetical protein